MKGWLDETTSRLPAIPVRWSDVGGQWGTENGVELIPRVGAGPEEPGPRFNAVGMRSDGEGGVGAMDAHVRPGQQQQNGAAGIKF